MNQLKYLVLIPMLVSMLFYTSCTEDVIKEGVDVYKQAENEVSFLKIDKAPTFPGCEAGDKACFSEGVQQYFTRNFDADLTDKLALSSNKIRVFVSFKVDESGNVGEVKVRAPHLKIEEEVLKVMNSLPKMTPGKHNNTVVGVKYTIPFTLKNGSSVIEVTEKREVIEKLEKLKNHVNSNEEISFIAIDKAPTFPGCEAGDKRCFSLMVQKHFSKNFNADLPKTLGLSSGRKRVFISFKIDKEGNVVDVKSRAPHPEIEVEVARVMNSLPKMIPGEHENNKITVKYSIPFTIVIE